MKELNVVLVTTRHTHKIDDDFFKDIEEAVLYTSHNLALRHNCTVTTPLQRTECLPDRAVRLYLLTESEDITIDNMGRHLRGISAYLLKKWPDKYNKYKRGTRLFYIMEGSTWK